MPKDQRREWDERSKKPEGIMKLLESRNQAKACASPLTQEAATEG